MKVAVRWVATLLLIAGLAGAITTTARWEALTVTAEGKPPTLFP